MARNALFNFRRSRGNKKNTKRVLSAILAVILLAGIAKYNTTPSVPSLAQPITTGKIQLVLPDRQNFFMHILGQVIPGIIQPDVIPEESGHSVPGEDLATGVAKRLDPRDPKRIFFAQIPYFGDVDIQPQSLLHQVNTVEAEDLPRIIIPAQAGQGSGNGWIIVYHTHTTESFVPTSGKNFSENLELTVARLGLELTNLLRNKYNIPVIHNRQIHDIPRSTSYETALVTATELLRTYPDTNLIIDLHRDGIDRKISTARINGENMGKVLFVVGSRHPNWQENYNKALFLHEYLEKTVPGLSRGVRERPLVYNQHLHTGALLVEVGGHENSLEEALRTIPYLAHALANLYNE